MIQGVRFAHRNIHLSMDKSPPWPEGPIQRDMKGGHAHLRWAIAWAKPTRVSRSCSNETNSIEISEKNQFCRWERTQIQLKFPKKNNFAGEREPKINWMPMCLNIIMINVLNIQDIYERITLTTRCAFRFFAVLSGFFGFLGLSIATLATFLCCFSFILK